jgi:hypothetical protein
MSNPIFTLSLDSSFPDSDPRNGAASQAGVIRFIDIDDDNTLASMNRFAGDLVNRSLIIERKVNELVELLNSNPQLTSFDSTPFVLTDGSHAFTGVIGGVTPTLSAHLSTKGYVDGAVGTLGSTVQEISTDLAETNAAMPTVRRSEWTVFTWQGGTKQVVDLLLTTAIDDLSKIISVVLMEELTSADESIVYRQLSHGTNAGMRVDDIWVTDNTHVRVLLPSTSEFATGYAATSGYGSVANPTSRRLRAIVVEVG